MKRKIVTVLLVTETSILLIALALGGLLFKTKKAETEVYRQSSEDGSQTVVIYEVGQPDWPFGNAHYKVYGPSNFSVDVSDDGGSGGFTVEWKESSVVIIFSGSEQEDAVYELPFNINFQ